MAWRTRKLTHPNLPHRLADLPEVPQALYVRGELPRGPAVAIVGTRAATPLGLGFAEALSHDLSRAGVAVLSGGAEGIDTAAHLGALRAGGVTAVVAPAGFRRPFPEENAELFARVVHQGGAYASLVPDRKPATRGAFFSRNACLVALAHVVVVVEAGLRSGALNAARWARELKRPLLVVPHAPWSVKGRGCIVELRRGARICAGPRDVLRELDRMLLRPLPLDDERSAQPMLPFAGPVGRAAESDAITAAIACGAVHPDQIAEVTGLALPAIHSQILTLTLAGVLAPDPSGGLVLSKGPGPGFRLTDDK